MVVLSLLWGGGGNQPASCWLAQEHPQNSLLLVLKPHFAPIHPPPVPGGLFPTNGRLVVNWFICGLCLYVTSLILLIALVRRSFNKIYYHIYCILYNLSYMPISHITTNICFFLNHSLHHNHIIIEIFNYIYCYIPVYITITLL